MTKQEAKVSTFFLASVTGAFTAGALTRILTLHHAEVGSVVAFVVGILALVWTIIHVGLED